MKRSRTCHCLVELDDTPKRTRSTSNLDSLKRRSLVKAPQQQQQQQQQAKLDHDPIVNEGRQNFDLASAVRLLRRTLIPAEGVSMAQSNLTMLTKTKSSPLDGSGKARSKSLNEITILEDEQYIGHGCDLTSFMRDGDLRFASASTMHDTLQESDYGYMFEDTEDFNDYFYGVASSDEADDDPPLIPICAALVGSSPHSPGDESNSDKGIDGGYLTLVTSGTGSPGQSDGQASDSSATAWSEDTATLSGAEGDSVDPLASTSPSAWAKLRGSALSLNHDGHDNTCVDASASPPSPPHTLVGDEWRPSFPKFNVKVISPKSAAITKTGDDVSSLSLPEAVSLGSALDGRGGWKQQQQQQPKLGTVLSPWPTVLSATMARHDRSPTRLRGGEMNASNDAGLVLSVACGIDRLGLTDSKPKLAPLVEVGPNPVDWNSWDVRAYEDAALESPYPRSGKV